MRGVLRGIHFRRGGGGIMDMKKLKGIVFNGIVTENPTFRLVLGM